MRNTREEESSGKPLEDSFLSGGEERKSGGRGDLLLSRSEDSAQRQQGPGEFKTPIYSQCLSQWLATRSFLASSFTLARSCLYSAGGKLLVRLPPPLRRLLTASEFFSRSLKTCWRVTMFFVIALALWLRSRKLKRGATPKLKAENVGWAKLPLYAFSSLVSKSLKLTGKGFNGALTEIPFSVLYRQVSLGGVSEVTYSGGGRVVASLKSDPSISRSDSQPLRVTAALVPGSEALFFKEVAGKVPFFRNKPQPTLLDALSFCFPLIVLAVWWRLLRSLVDSSSATSRGSNATGASRGAPRPLSFSDVICDEKRELQELVQYLRSKTKLRELERRGGRLPRGLLLVGPPGTGKTSLARALAAEGNVSFLGAAAAEFVEIYVGQGAKRVRETFREARRRAPCILFIDEIDAFGCRGGGGAGGGRGGATGSFGASSDEYIQTLNQLLFEMDGLYGAEGVLVLAATNRLHALDSALLRSGRFDRIVYLKPPHFEHRRQILKRLLCTKGLALGEGTDQAVEALASGSEGLTGADLENLVNESVLMASRRDSLVVEPQDFYQALERIHARLANQSETSGQAQPGSFRKLRFSLHDEPF